MTQEDKKLRNAPEAGLDLTSVEKHTSVLSKEDKHQTAAELDRQKFEFEMRKWEQECRYKQDSIRVEKFKAWLTLASSSAIITALTAAIGVFGNKAVRSFEERRFETQLILEVVKTPDPNIAIANLKFLVEAGLVSNMETRNSLIEFFSRHEGGPSIPKLPK